MPDSIAHISQERKESESERTPERILAHCSMDKGIDLTSLAVKGRGFDEKIRPTLDLLDKVRSHLADVDLVDTHFIPSLAVIGKQSSGKSSVLERLACCPLPRGDGMVTMNPLIMELRYSESESCEIGLSTDKMKSVSIEEVSTHIRRFAQVIREGNNSGYDFSSQPIYLRIQKPTLRDLTLIDLPGEYDVNKDTHLADERIRNTVKALYEEFCLSPKCTIICVLPATEDTVNHVARGWSREWDPSGQRTIGVLTKCDLVQKEKSLRERIEGRGVNSTGLQHLVAVCNPLQETDDVKIEGVEDRFLKIQSEEEMFFKTKFGSFYENLAEKCGIEALVDALVVIQARSFDGVIPEVLSSIAAERLKLEDDLRQFPEAQVLLTHRSRQYPTAPLFCKPLGKKLNIIHDLRLYLMHTPKMYSICLQGCLQTQSICHCVVSFKMFGEKPCRV